MNKKEVITELQNEVKILEERLGNARLALRGFGSESGTATATVRKQRVHITPEMREKYNQELVAVLEAFGSCSVKELCERGNFEGLSETSVYRLAIAHPRVNKTQRGRVFIFSLRP